MAVNPAQGRSRGCRDNSAAQTTRASVPGWRRRGWLPCKASIGWDAANLLLAQWLQKWDFLFSREDVWIGERSAKRRRLQGSRRALINRRGNTVDGAVWVFLNRFANAYKWSSHWWSWGKEVRKYFEKPISLRAFFFLLFSNRFWSNRREREQFFFHYFQNVFLKISIYRVWMFFTRFFTMALKLAW